MNNSYYPSLELCKKLTEIGFPECRRCYSRYFDWKLDKDEEWVIFAWALNWVTYVCPSVMEMLDVMPIEIKTSAYRYVLTTFPNSVWYFNFNYLPRKEKKCIKWTPPNALAQMILWLVENKYLTFNK
jgi:hypothetical protein